MSNWKTTVAAVGAAAFAVYQVSEMVRGTATMDEVMAAIFAALAGFGFSFAQDSDQSPALPPKP